MEDQWEVRFEMEALEARKEAVRIENQAINDMIAALELEEDRKAKVDKK